MRYLWLHGFASGPTSSKGQFVRIRLRERGIELEIPDLNEPAFEFLADAARHESFPLPRCPTLVIQGTRDDVVDPALAREFVRRMEDRAQLVELAEGHELTADLPALWRRIDEFLASHAARPTP